MANSIVRKLANWAYWSGAILGHIVAKFQLGYKTHNNWERPGTWMQQAESIRTQQPIDFGYWGANYSI